MATCSECPASLLGAGRGRRQCSESCRHHARIRQGREYRLRLRERVYAHKVAIGCGRCGFNAHGAALDWHHPNDDKERRLTVKSYFTPLGVAERAKCILICANCHRIEHNEDRKIESNGDV